MMEKNNKIYKDEDLLIDRLRKYKIKSKWKSNNSIFSVEYDYQKALGEARLSEIKEILKGHAYARIEKRGKDNES